MRFTVLDTLTSFSSEQIHRSYITAQHNASAQISQYQKTNKQRAI